MGESLLRSIHSGKYAALALVLLPLVASDLSPVCAAPRPLEFETASFLDDPPQIIRENPTGGERLVVEVRDLALSDPATLQPILGLLPQANKAQKAAIAAGLAWAARISGRLNLGYATEIQQAVAQTKDQDLILGYAAATGKYIGAGGAKSGFGGGIAEEGLPPETNGVAEQFGGPRSAPPSSASSNIASVFVPEYVGPPSTSLQTAVVAVPGAPVPNVETSNGAPVPNVEIPSVTVPNVEVPGVETSSVAVSNFEVPGVTVPSVTVSASTVALPNFFAAPSVVQTTTSINESVSPN